MKSINPAMNISIGGFLTALAILFQSSPVFLPGIGLILSPLATLPVALAAATSTYMGVLSLFSSALILLFISPQEAVIFFLTTGPLGLILGAINGKKIVKSIIFSATTLFAGIIILTYVIGIAAFGDMTPSSALLPSALIFMAFTVFYSAVWVLILKFFINILSRTKQFRVFKTQQKK